MVVDHQNWFGLDDTMGPAAISIKREKVDAVLSQFENNCNFSSGSVTQLCRYRLIVRSTEVSNLLWTFSNNYWKIFFIRKGVINK